MLQQIKNIMSELVSHDYMAKNNINFLVKWLSKKYNINIERAVNTNSVYVQVNKCGVYICNIRISDHSEVYGKYDMYVMASANSNKYIVYFGENRQPLVFNKINLIYFIKNYILIKQLDNYKKILVAQKKMDSEKMTKQIIKDAEEDIKSEDLSNNNSGIQKFNDRSFLSNNWQGFFNEYIVPKCPSFANLTPQQISAISNEFLKKSVYLVSIETLTNGLIKIYTNDDGSYGRTITDFCKWASEYGKILSNKRLADSLNFEKTKTRSGNWKVFETAYLIPTFKWYNTLNKNVKPLIQSLYTKDLSYTHIEITAMLNHYIELFNGNINNAIEKLRADLKKEAYDKKTQKTNKNNISKNEKIEEPENTEQCNDKQVIENISDQHKEDLIIKKDNTKKVDNEYTKQIKYYGLMTAKQTKIVNDLFDMAIEKTLVIMSINEANKYGTDIKKMNKAYMSLINSDIANMAPGEKTKVS